MTATRLGILFGFSCVVAFGAAADADAPRASAPAAEPSGMRGFATSEQVAERRLEAQFDAAVVPADLDGWLRRMASAPNQVGSPHDRDNAQWQLALFKSWGWNAHIETFDVLYPTPISVSLSLSGPTKYQAKLVEPKLAADATSDAPGQLPPYVAYQGDGDVTAALVYVNHGMPADYEALARMGVDVRGKIVIARYGDGWRGLKPKLAQEHGAVGCVIYSDPADDGYASGDVYPKGSQRPPSGVQRGSVADITLFPGDPLTPGIGSTKGAVRLSRAAAPTILKIPTLPISYADARPFLAALTGPVAPRSWRGALPITYHVGPGAAVAHLKVRSEWSLKTIYDVIATMKGAELPDEWIIRGNHHDGWVFGASDPLSGQVALMAEAKAIGALVAGGWRPARTLIYASWDAEEPGLIGSTEWAETHAADLQQHAVLYVNSDDIDRGFLRMGGSPALTGLVNEVARSVRDPETGASLDQRLRAKLELSGFEGGDEREKRAATQAAAGTDLPLEALGSGSDFSSFLQHLGIATLDIGFGGEGRDEGVYHSAYDSYDHYRRFGDPGEVYGAALAQTVGRVVLRAAQADLPAMRFSAAAEAFANWAVELKTLARTRRERGQTLERLLDIRAFNLAADPQITSIPPQREAAVGETDFGPLDQAIERVSASARAYDAAFDARIAAGRSDPATRRRVGALLLGMEQRLLDPRGLPQRPWYRNLAYAPGMLTGYGAKTFPGVREALEDDHAAIAADYIELTAAALRRYAAGLDEGTAALTSH